MVCTVTFVLSIKVKISQGTFTYWFQGISHFTDRGVYWQGKFYGVRTQNFLYWTLRMSQTRAENPFDGKGLNWELYITHRPTYCGDFYKTTFNYNQAKGEH